MHNSGRISLWASLLFVAVMMLGASFATPAVAAGGHHHARNGHHGHNGHNGNNQRKSHHHHNWLRHFLRWR